MVMSAKAVTYFNPSSLLSVQKLVFFQNETGEKWACQVIMMQKTIRKTCFNVIDFLFYTGNTKRDLKDHL